MKRLSILLAGVAVSSVAGADVTTIAGAQTGDYVDSIIMMRPPTSPPPDAGNLRSPSHAPKADHPGGLRQTPTLEGFSGPQKRFIGRKPVRRNGT